MLSLDQINILKGIYAFNSIKTYGPYSSNGRKTLIIDMDGKKRCRLLAAWLVEIKFNRKNGKE